MYRGNVIPAYAGIQSRGAAWIPACAGMTTTLRAPYVDTPEYITRSSGNMLWVYIKGNRYAFRYEHADDTIEIHDNTFKGPLLHKINNQTSITQLKTIFQNL
ncbi:MAG: hypothetical protein ACRD5H_07945 [Nitrososphaerales archaeon]